MDNLRKDFEIIVSYIDSGSIVLDLGCANGKLLVELDKKNCEVRGIEKNFNKMNDALSKNIPVFLGDINRGLDLYNNQFFDYIILSYTIQQLNKPQATINKMLKKGKKAIVSFSNYGYYLNRISFAFSGKKPHNQVYGKNWYNTNDIHQLTIRDFEIYCSEQKITILRKTFLRGDWKQTTKLLPNLFAGYAIYLVTLNS